MNPYDAIAIDGQKEAPAAAHNPYDQIDVVDTAPAKVSLSVAIDRNPGDTARAVRLARQLGAPFEAVNDNLAEAEKGHKLDAYERMLSNAPKTTEFLALPDRAGMAHDDVENLTGLEAAFQVFKNSGRAVAAAIPQMNAGLWGAAAAPFELLGADTVGGWLREQQKITQGMTKAWGPQGPSSGNIESGWYSGLTSAGQNLLTMPLAFMPGGQNAALSAMVAPVFGESYGKARDKGLTPLQGINFGAQDAVAEWAGERLGLGSLVKNVKGGSGFGKTILDYLAREVPSELATTLAQSFNEYTNINPDKAVGDWLQQLPDELAQTVVATLVGGGAITTAVSVADRTLRAIAGKELDAEQTGQMGDLLAGLNKLAEASKLRERDTVTAQGFFQSILEEGRDSIYITPEALAQSGLAEQMARAIPAVAEQLGTAAETGHDIRIPIADLMATMAGPEFEQSILPHVAVEPGGFTPTTAQEYLQSDHAQELQAEVERVLSAKQGDDAFKASADVVKTNIKEQLATAGRFTESVNDAYSAMVGNFYAVQAARMGTTPEAMFQRYPLRIGAESVAGQQFDQGGTLADLRQQWADSGIKNAISEKDGVITLSQIVVPEGERGAGNGTAAMQALIDYADRTGQHVALSPSADFGGNKKRLVQFYKRFGFVENKGKNRAFTTSESMYRQAQGKVLHQSEKDILDLFKEADTINIEAPKMSEQEIDDAQRVFLSHFPKSVTTYRRSSGIARRIRKASDHAADAIGEDPSTPRTVERPLGPFSRYEVIGEVVAPDEFYNPGGALKVKIYGKEQVEAGLMDEPALTFTVMRDGELSVNGPTPGGATFEAFQANGWAEQSKAGDQIAEGWSNIVNPDGGKMPMAQTIALLADVHARVRAWKMEDYTGLHWARATGALAGNGDYGSAIFLQGDRARGSFNPETLQLTLLKNADLSTFLHESGHFFLEVQADLAGQLLQEAAIHGADTLKTGERQVLTDMQATLDWFGVKDLAEWDALDFEEKRSYHEQFARGFEAYLFEGKAPAIEMQGVFQRFRAWLLNVYRDLKALNIELTDEVRGVFDRMLATSEQIVLAEQGRSMMPLFTSPEQIGMTSAEFADYQALGVDATNEAIEELQARGLRDMQWIDNARGRIIKALKKESAEKRAEVQMEVRAEVMAQPIYRAWQFLTGKVGEKTEAQVAHDKALADWKSTRADFEQKTSDDLKAKLLEANPDIKGIQRGQLLAKKKRQMGIDTQQAMLEWDRANPKPEAPTAPAEGETAGGFDFGRLNLDELKAMGIPADVVNALKARRMTAKEGLHPDLVADMFGFSSGDELARRLAAAETPKDEINALTDQRMLERYGDLSSEDAIKKAADKAIHNEARARMIAAELNALENALGATEQVGTNKNGRPIMRRILPSAAKEYAAAMIARLKVRDIKPGQYASAEVRAGKAAEKASKAGDIATAAAEQRNRLINNYATRAAYDAQDEILRGLRYLKKFDSAGTRKGLDADYTDQIDALLDRFDLRKGQSLKAIDKRTSFAKWLEAQREAGMEPDVPDDLVNEAFQKSYKDLTVEEMRGLVDTVKQIEHMGRLKNKLLTARDQRAYEAVRDEIAASIHANAQGREADTRTPTTNMGRAVQGLKRFWAAHIKAATWARIMDGGKDGGPVWEYFVRSANEAGDMETSMRAEATGKLSEILAPVFKLGKMGGKGQFFPTINRSLNREARIAIALNIGNAGNIQRLLGGEGWTVAQITPVMQSLTTQEWAAVQAVWDHFESYRPQIAAKERRIYGKEPDWVAPQPFSVKTADGQDIQLRGGYYPIKYDPAASQRAEEHNDAEAAKRQLQGAYTTATTRRSFTKSRVEEVAGRPLLYTLSGLYSGVNDVIHDLAWHEWLIDANRLLRSSTIDSAVREHYGPEAKQQFKTWVQDVAEGEKGADAAVDMAIARLRQGVSAAGLGFNVMSAAIQPLGITQSIVRVGAPYIARGVVKYLAHPIDAARETVIKSSFMENRARTRFRELNELRNQVQDQSAFKEIIGRYAYFLMMRCQQMVDVPTWLGAYEKAIAEGNDDDMAINLADQAVIDSQGGGQTKDLSAIERGGPTQKLFTVFYSFMNTALNIGVAQTMSADTPAKRAKLAADYALLYVVPAILGYFLKAALTPGDSGDDDPEKIAKKLLANQIDYLMGLMVVVREFGEAAKTVSGANDLGRDYTGPAGLRLVADSVTLAKQAHQGEFDDAFRKASINVIGDIFGLPSAQINRTITGAKALAEGETSNPAAIAFGFQTAR